MPSIILLNTVDLNFLQVLDVVVVQIFIPIVQRAESL